MKPFSLAIVGATGVVGLMFLKVLEERDIHPTQLILFASKKSAGKTLTIHGKSLPVHELTEANVCQHRVDYALFSAGSFIAETFAPLFVKQGAIVIDNSSFYRMHSNVPLIVPEVNADAINLHQGIIANPNCSTVQLVMALAPLHQTYGLKRIIVSTYQAVSGAGQTGIHDLLQPEEKLTKFPFPIQHNLIPHIDVFLANGRTKEEQKVIDETKKIMNLPHLAISATAVRVPVLNAHAESVHATFEKPISLAKIREILTDFKGVQLYDDPSKLIYPMPLTASGKDDVYVGRLRIDENDPHALELFIVGDNIRKGSATNAVQILLTLQSSFMA
jgi:aspartate-semialdehyde dehydrogenase